MNFEVVFDVFPWFVELFVAWFCLLGYFVGYIFGLATGSAFWLFVIFSL